MESDTIDHSTTHFSYVNGEDRGGVLWIVTILSVIYSSLSTLARVRVKWGLYGIDDCLIVASTVRKSQIIFSDWHAWTAPLMN